MKFKNFADATSSLIAEFEKKLTLDNQWQVLAVGNLSRDLAAALAEKFDLISSVIEVTRERDELNFVQDLTINLPQISKSKLLICDIGVETGTTAIAIADLLLARNAQSELALAALVVPQEIKPLLQTRFQVIVSARSPLVRRSLAWEFEEFS